MSDQLRTSSPHRVKSQVTDNSRKSLAEEAGNAFLWRTFSIGAENCIFLFRLLVLARLLIPEDFGLYAIGITVIGLAGRLTEFGLNAAVVQDPIQQKQTLDTAWTIALIRGSSITLALLIAAPYISMLFAEPRATDIIRMVALVTFLKATASIQLPLVIRALRFRRLALLSIAAAVANTAVSIYFARSAGVWALVYGSIAGALTYSIGSYLVAPYRPSFRLSRKATARLMHFGRWIFLASILAVMSDAILRWIVSTRLGTAELGLFFMAARLAALPTVVITGVFKEVAFPVYSRLQHNSHKLAESYRTVLVAMQVLLIPASLVFLSLVPGLVEFVLGPQWTGATELLQILVLASLLSLLGESSIPLVMGTGHPERIVTMMAARTAVLVTLAWVLMDQFGLSGAGLSYLISSVFLQFLAVHNVLRTVSRPFSGLGRTSVAILFAAMVGAVVSFGVSSESTGPLGVLGAAVSGTLVAAATGLILDRIFGLQLLQRTTEAFPALASIIGNMHRKDRGS